MDVCTKTVMNRDIYARFTIKRGEEPFSNNECKGASTRDANTQRFVADITANAENCSEPTAEIHDPATWKNNIYISG